LDEPARSTTERASRLSLSSAENEIPSARAILHKTLIVGVLLPSST
jgi:hypothetical protein